LTKVTHYTHYWTLVGNTDRKLDRKQARYIARLSNIFFLKFRKLIYTSYSWAKNKPDTLIIVFASIFLHSAMRKLVIATYRTRLLWDFFRSFFYFIRFLVHCRTRRISKYTLVILVLYLIVFYSLSNHNCIVYNVHGCLNCFPLNNFVFSSFPKLL
jgi:hypothetical protein